MEALWALKTNAKQKERFSQVFDEEEISVLLLISKTSRPPSYFLLFVLCCLTLRAIFSYSLASDVHEINRLPLAVQGRYQFSILLFYQDFCASSRRLSGS